LAAQLGQIPWLAFALAGAFGSKLGLRLRRLLHALTYCSRYAVP
jgi:hypothetical protein